MGLDGTPRHFQFAGNFGIVTTLQQEVGDLLLSRTQANSLLRHPNYPKSPNTLEIEVGFCDLPFTHARLLGDEKINVSAVSKQRAFEMPYGTIFSSILWTISPGPTSHTTRELPICRAERGFYSLSRGWLRREVKQTHPLRSAPQGISLTSFSRRNGRSSWVVTTLSGPNSTTGSAILACNCHPTGGMSLVSKFPDWRRPRN